MSHPRIIPAVILLCLACMLSSMRALAADRQVIPLDHGWLFQRQGAAPDAWKPVTVPSCMQEHEGNDFHGVGIYRIRTPKLSLQPGQRLLLQFDAVATRATIFFDDKQVADHLGGWTPIRVDVTSFVRAEHEIRVRVDEKVGHNTQGFLPVIEPHFGGIWQPVSLIIVPETFIDDLGLLARGNPDTGAIDLRIPIDGPAAIRQVTVRTRLRGSSAWTEHPADLHRTDTGTFTASVPVADIHTWSPQSPSLYDVDIRLPASAGADHITTRAAFRTVQAMGNYIRFNGHPLVIRGVLNWGYYPPHLPPYPDEQRFRRDISLARSWGFNLMKFCLWVPPRRFLEIADEMGMLTWIEYPTWHPTLDQAHLPELQREFGEFFRYDRRHPSIILRSLTCETGPSADINVLKRLYDMAHREIPGALVEDDSSWIGWNRINDFYDDHPYGNNRPWPGVLDEFRQYILAHGPKPLVLGEAIAADTWPDRAFLAQHVKPTRPYWVPGFFEALQPWEERMRGIAGPGGLDRLAPDSLHYAMLMRKYQVEAYRREIPYGGYVVSELRDFSTAAMGLLDYADQPKWTPAQWQWHGPTMLLLQTDHDRRAFAAGTTLHARLLLSNMAPEKLADGQLSVTLIDPRSKLSERARASKDKIAQNPGTLATLLNLDFPLPATDTPRQMFIDAQLKSSTGTVENRWPVWIVPQPSFPAPADLWLHPSLRPDIFPGAPRAARPAAQTIAIASAFDDALIDFLDRGGRVLMLPDGSKGSFRVADHWFLRGAPYLPDNPIHKVSPRDLWVELQHFDLSGPVVPDMNYLEMVDPIVMLWDNHDLRTVKTHGLLFETRASAGRLMVSTLRLGAGDGANPAGQWILSVLLRHLATAPAPTHALSSAAWQHVREKLHEQTIDLTRVNWQFKPDPKDQGLKQNWASPDYRPDASWKPIRVGTAWDGQGYPGLTGYGWYRLAYTIPADWKNREIYITFDGVDDSYDLYIDGHPAGHGGDKPNRRTAFDQRLTHRLTNLVTPGRQVIIAVRVDNWQGAGGLFRPVRLTTCAPLDNAEVIR